MAIRVYSIMVENKEEALQAIASVGADQAGCRWMAPKAVHRLVIVGFPVNLRVIPVVGRVPGIRCDP